MEGKKVILTSQLSLESQAFEFSEIQKIPISSKLEQEAAQNKRPVRNNNFNVIPGSLQTCPFRWSDLCVDANNPAGWKMCMLLLFLLIFVLKLFCNRHPSCRTSLPTSGWGWAPPSGDPFVLVLLILRLLLKFVTRYVRCSGKRPLSLLEVFLEFAKF